MITWITGDHHFGHTNIIKYCNRPFSCVGEMDSELISIWQGCVAPDDVVLYLGDFTLGNKEQAAYYFAALNGKINVLYNPWHHDKRWLPGVGASGFTSRSTYMPYIFPPIVVLGDVGINEDGDSIPAVLCHYEFLNWDRKHYGSYHFFGHSHGTSTPRHNCLDVGIDNAFKLVGEYRPLKLDEAVKFASQIPA
jgi:calcineurin-like phosphoesterase family protein